MRSFESRDNPAFPQETCRRLRVRIEEGDGDEEEQQG